MPPSQQEHSKALYADNDWVKSRVKAVVQANAAATNDDHLAALLRDSHAEERNRRITMTADSCLIYLVQCLDRCAAIAAIVGALDVDVLKVGWGALQALNREYAKPPKRGTGTTLPSPEGLEIQRELVGEFARWPEFGPPGWLDWLIQTRNAHAHRAHATAWSVVVGSKRGGGDLCRPFYRRPEMSEMQSMATINPGAKDLSGHVLLEESGEVLKGLVHATADLAVHLVSKSRSVWGRRREDPTILTQPRSQWKMDGIKESGFAGFGNPVSLHKDTQVHVHPTLGRRLAAAKVLDADSAFWA